MAIAISSVLQTKYAVAAPVSGFATASTLRPRTPGTPPRLRKAKPASWTAMARHAMLNNVRYAGFFAFILNVHWLQALVTATSMVSCGPSRRSAAKSTAYDTDIVDPLLESGRLTLNAEVAADSSRRMANRVGLSKGARGPNMTRSTAPVTMTAPT